MHAVFILKEVRSIYAVFPSAARHNTVIMAVISAMLIKKLQQFILHIPVYFLLPMPNFYIFLSLLPHFFQDDTGRQTHSSEKYLSRTVFPHKLLLITLPFYPKEPHSKNAQST